MADWQQLIFEPGPPGPGILEAALFAQGALSVTLLDAADQPILEPAPGTTPLWARVRVVGLFPGGEALGLVVDRIGANLDVPLPASRVERLPEQDWRRLWLKDLKPMRFGSRLWVCPGGQKPDEDTGVVVELDPGLAFGTGSHPTTALCLEWLEKTVTAGRRVLDCGCGSGILAVAVRKLGAEFVVAVDIDPQALLATAENAERNSVSDGLICCEPGDLSKDRFDVLIANILAEPLMDMAPGLAGLAAPGAAIGLSGILREQATTVEQRYETWFDMGATAIMDNWVLLTGIRNAA